MEYGSRARIFPQPAILPKLHLKLVYRLASHLWIRLVTGCRGAVLLRMALGRTLPAPEWPSLDNGCVGVRCSRLAAIWTRMEILSATTITNPVFSSSGDLLGRPDGTPFTLRARLHDNPECAWCPMG